MISDTILVDISRSQFAVTTVFHMLWPLLSIGLSLLLVVLEIMWMRTGKDLYYRQERYWLKIFLLTFGIGVASGIPLEFQFGTNWSRFASAAGGLFGNILAFEASISFALEAAFLAIFVFGWKRVSRRMHLFSGIMVAFGASLSAFWIMSANSWMHTPTGVRMENGFIVITSYLKAIFNPDLPVAFIHIWVASIETTVFFVAGICAWNILKRRNIDFFLHTFKIVVVVGIIAAPLQIFLGDASGLVVAKYQPAKSAAMEGHWETNAPGEGAPWVVFAIPDTKNESNRLTVEIPYMLSVLDTRSLTGKVVGLKDIPPDERPPVGLPFFAFRIMFALGVAMFILAVLALWLWFRKRLKTDAAPTARWFWRLWIVALPAGFIATECGWIVREVGRQPWIIYNLMRTSEGVSPVSLGAATGSLVVFSVIYSVLLTLFILVTARIVKKGPDLESPVPSGKRT